MLEAVNENRADCFGWAIEGALEERGFVKIKQGECGHHHKSKSNLVGKGRELEGMVVIRDMRGSADNL